VKDGPEGLEDEGTACCAETDSDVASNTGVLCNCRTNEGSVLSYRDTGCYCQCVEHVCHANVAVQLSTLGRLHSQRHSMQERPHAVNAGAWLSQQIVLIDSKL
jgi:hypothetical protein